MLPPVTPVHLQPLAQPLLCSDEPVNRIKLFEVEISDDADVTVLKLALTDALQPAAWMKEVRECVGLADS